MNALDVAALSGMVLAAAGGYRTGLIARVGGWVGGLLGLLLAVRLIRPVLDAVAPESPQHRLLLALLTVLVCAVGVQAIGLMIAARVRSRLGVGTTARLTDHRLGSVAGALSVVFLLWLLTPMLSRVPGEIARQARTSRVLAVIAQVTPDGVNPLTGIQNVIAATPFPEVFDDLLAAPEVGPPPETLPLSAAVLAGVTSSTVNVEVSGCGRLQEGSGFVVADGLIATNAHVVAGGEGFQVLRDDGRRLDGVLVAFDPARDLALLQVPGMDRAALPLADVPDGTELAVFGHPDGQDPLRIAPARQSDRITANGRDIYGAAPVSRDVLVLASELRQGDSGSAVVNASGQVVGVVFAVAADRSGVAYALARPEVEAVLGTRSAAPVGSGPCA